MMKRRRLFILAAAGMFAMTPALAEEQMKPLPPAPPVISAPRLDVTQPQPDPQDFYTAELKDAGLQGIVAIDIYVLVDGTPDEMHIRHSSGAEPLDNAAKAVCERMRFVPGTINGMPHPMWASVAVTFKSSPDEPRPEPK